MFLRRLLSCEEVASNSLSSLSKAFCALLMLRYSFLTIVGGKLVIELNRGGILPVYSLSMRTSGKDLYRAQLLY